jgi:hypothetical protein
MKFLTYIGLFYLLIFFSSCEKVTEEPLDMGYSYFPVKQGMYAIYDVDSVFVECQFSIRDTYHFQLKEKLDTLFTDATGQLAMRIERSVRPDSTSPWQIRDVWWTYTKERRAMKVEENIPYVKMVFPVIENQEWNGNLYNFNAPWNYKYVSVHQPENIGQLNFDSVTTVLQFSQSSANLQDSLFYIEKYASNVGLISRDKIFIKGITLDVNDPCKDQLPSGVFVNDIPLMNRIRFASIWKQRIIDYGYE